MALRHNIIYMEDKATGSGNELSEKQLKWGYWWVQNKIMVRKVFTVVLGVIGFSLFAYGAWGFADWFLGSGVRERAGVALLTQNLTDYGYFREVSQPQPIVTQQAQVLSSGEGRYDLIAKVSNPNQRWWLEFDYRFAGAGLPDEVRTAYILPVDTRYVYQLGIESEQRPAVSFEVLEVRWRRVDGHQVRPDYLSWSEERLNFLIEEPEFMPPERGAALPISRVMFTVTNDSGFSYVAAPFFVTLFSGSRVVGVNRVVATRFMAGEIREIEASWFNELPSVTRVEVRPEINLFDEEVYLAPGE